MSCLKRADYIGVASYTLFFIVTQTLFFIFIASKTYENIIFDKMSLFTSLIKNTGGEVYYQQYKESMLVNLKKEADNQDAMRNKENTEILRQYIYVYILVYLVFISAILIFTKGPWGKYDWINLIFIATSYVTEIYIFFLIISRYVLVPDYHIISNLFSKSEV